MNNYEKMLEAARLRFLDYDISRLASRPGVTDEGDRLTTQFLGQRAEVRKADGRIFLDGQPANFGQGLTIYDWLCDGKPDACASYDFCPVTSLPGIFVAGKGLTLNGDRLASAIDKNPEAFRTACKALGGTEIAAGDMGFQLMPLPGLPMQLKFYHSDEEFPATLTLLWDKNILQFLRYETVYYLAGCLLRRLEQKASPWGEAVSEAD